MQIEQCLAEDFHSSQRAKPELVYSCQKAIQVRHLSPLLCLWIQVLNFFFASFQRCKLPLFTYFAHAVVFWFIIMLLFINIAYKVDTGHKFVTVQSAVNGATIIFPATLVQEFNYSVSFYFYLRKWHILGLSVSQSTTLILKLRAFF